MNRNLQKRRAATRMSMEDYAETVGVELAPVTVPEAVPAVASEVVPADVVSGPIDAEIAAQVREEAEDSYVSDSIATLSQVGQNLTTIHDKIGATLPNGGLTPGEAEAWRTAVDVTIQDVPVAQDGPAMPSQESFGGSLSRVEATKLTMESIMEKVKKVGAKGWELIVSMFQKMVERLTSVGRKIKDTVARLDSNYRALADYADRKIEIELPEEAIAYLSVNGSFSPNQAQRWFETQYLPYVTKVIPYLNGAIDKLTAGVKNGAGGNFDAEAVKAPEADIKIDAGIDAVEVSDNDNGVQYLSKVSKSYSATTFTIDVRQVLAMKSRSVTSFTKAAGFGYDALAGKVKNIVSTNGLISAITKKGAENEGNELYRMWLLAATSAANAILDVQKGIISIGPNFVVAWGIVILRTVEAAKKANAAAKENNAGSEPAEA